MNLSEIQGVIFAVLKDYRVILCSIGVIFYLNFISYVVSYQKKPPRIKKKKLIIASAAPAAPKEEQAEEDDKAAENPVKKTKK